MRGQEEQMVVSEDCDDGPRLSALVVAALSLRVAFLLSPAPSAFSSQVTRAGKDEKSPVVMARLSPPQFCRWQVLLAAKALLARSPEAFVDTKELLVYPMETE